MVHPHAELFITNLCQDLSIKQMFLIQTKGKVQEEKAKSLHFSLLPNTCNLPCTLHRSVNKKTHLDIVWTLVACKERLQIQNPIHALEIQAIKQIKEERGARGQSDMSHTLGVNRRASLCVLSQPENTLQNIWPSP